MDKVWLIYVCVMVMCDDDVLLLMLYVCVSVLIVSVDDCVCL